MECHNLRVIKEIKNKMTIKIKYCKKKKENVFTI